MVYVIHSDATTCLGNHALNFSSFSCQAGETWVASITLRCWKENSGKNESKPLQQPKGQCRFWRRPIVQNNRAGDYGYGEDRPITLRKSQENAWSKSQREEVKKGELRFELDVSSIVLSTNAFGDFSKCTIVSELIEEEDVGELAEAARRLWQKFIHQPQTARCLVFFLMLGRLCQRIHKKYIDATDKLAEMLALNVSRG